MKNYKVEVDHKGNVWWFNEAGQLHREDGPAIEWATGRKEWYLNGLCCYGEQNFRDMLMTRKRWEKRAEKLLSHIWKF